MIGINLPSSVLKDRGNSCQSVSQDTYATVTPKANKPEIHYL